ncbi:MAG: YbaK/EbsC family protein [Candidatus Brockarchaeota archaeon]|nr:YbaK/EbsC family protein [Candidatus Brockarchaeota archaeon]MBO3842556.1 YbaK/EbsC family protein [Candidatus Brockarchaeota archaeon]
MPLSSKDLEAFLENRKVNYRIFFHGETYSAEKASRELGVSLDQVAKTVVFVNEKSEPLIVVVPGGRRVNQDRLAKTLGFKKLRLATGEEVLSHTGYEAGAVPPVGHLKQLPAVVDETLLSRGKVYAGGGAVNATLEISPVDIVRLLNAKVIKVP